MSTDQKQQNKRQHQHTNRLAKTSSPYLLQHAHNPVDWSPWGREAFERARRENKPIFLSIGYSTCYWCHVMERESFEDEATARILNEHFVPIKVDREEHPAVDDLYMMAVQVTTGRGGWPMSVWLEPEQLRPFLAGTYFPKEARHGLPSFTQMLESVDEAWRERKDEVVAQSERIAEAVRKQLATQRERVPVGVEQVQEAVSQLLGVFDAEHGGFGRAPKFPQPVYFDLLFAARAIASEETEATIDRAIRLTLDRMATGGMYDQVGGGFHRYSVDREWRVPHFEKMLYDQAQLASVYARAYGLYGDFYYAQIARETLAYVERELSDDDGGFFSAQDAEVNTREGGNYVWTPDEIRTALTDANAADLIEFTLAIYGLNDGPNFRDPHHPDDDPVNVLFLVDRPDALAQQMNLTAAQFNEQRAKVNEILLAVRDRRDQPLTDDKIITAWNGLMIAAFAEVGRRLEDSKLIDRAVAAAEFTLKWLRASDGGLHRTIRDGAPGPAAVLKDHACFLRGLLELASATGQPHWLRAAVELASATNETFGDHAHGGFFDTPADQSDLFIRARSSYDGAMPSGNGVMIDALVQLHELTGERIFLEEALRAIESISATLADGPHGPVLTTATLAWLAIQHPDQLPTRGDAPKSSSSTATDSDNDEPNAGATASTSTAPPTPQPVRVIPSVETITVPRGGSLACTLIIMIDDGYFITADHLEFSIEGDGWTLDAAPPAPRPIENAMTSTKKNDADDPRDAREAPRGYRSAVYVPITLETSNKNAAARATIHLRTQACTADACLPPTTLSIPAFAE